MLGGCIFNYITLPTHVPHEVSSMMECMVKGYCDLQASHYWSLSLRAHEADIYFSSIRGEFHDHMWNCGLSGL